jgi:molybdopterin-guanine dinucleotide biosynthesis protein A
VKVENICGLVVAGGASRRMGNDDKLWLKLGDEALIHRAIRRLNDHVNQVIVNANDTSGLEPYVTIPDVIEGGQGPLAGILSGLEHAQERSPHITHIASVPADAPFSPIDLVDKMQNAGSASEIIVPFVGGFSQQLFALWPISCAADLRRFLMSGENGKVMNFIRSQDWQKLELPDEFEEQFINVNTPQDWIRAKQMFESNRYE